MCKTRIGWAVVMALALAVNSATGDITEGLLGYWPLDGDAVDLSGNSHDGTLIGDAGFVDDAAFGSALELDGDGDYVDMQGYEGPMQSPWTLACWVKTTGTGDMDILSWGTEGGGLKVEFRFNAGLLRIEHGNGNIRGDVPANDGEWHHAVAQLPAGGVMKDVLFYLDGVSLDIFQIGNGDNPFITAPDIDFNIGRSGPRGDRHYTGLIDEVRIYDRILTTDEIKQLAAQPKARRPDPADGAASVEMPLLQWTPGDTAILHNLYLGTSPDLTEADLVAPQQPVALYYHAAGLTPGVTYYWRVDEIEIDMSTVHTGDVWSFTAQDIKAYNPSPTDGANDAAPAAMLAWLPGKAAITHKLYLGEDADAVGQGTAEVDKGELEEPAFTPDPLQSGTTYFWRVDGMLPDGTIQTGDVWSFTTYIPVDDMESYTDEEGSRIYETWIDGWTNGTSSTVGYIEAPFAEQTIVHGGLQSMPVDYNNINSPFYSEAEQSFAPAQDWTINEFDTLVLHVRGRGANGEGQVYVAIQDASNRTAVIVHPNAALATVGKWTEWTIPLSDLTAAGVDVSRVKTMYIGVGDRDNPAAGGAGLLFIDDIYLINSAAAGPSGT